MGFSDIFKDIVKKVPEIANSLTELSEDKDFQKHLGQAGAIGGLCVIGVDIAKKIRNDLQTPEKQAFGSILRIVFESTQEALPNSEKIKIKDIKSKDLINELFDIFTQIGYDWDFDLPSHPVIDKFKEHIKQIVETDLDHNSIDLTKFFIDFRVRIEDKAITDEKIMAIAFENIKPYYRGVLVRHLSEKLREYLKRLSELKDEVNPIDNKPFMRYYVKNKAVLVSKQTWYKKDIKEFKDQWTVEKFLEGKDWRVVIAAPLERLFPWSALP